MVAYIFVSEMPSNSQNHTFTSAGGTSFISSCENLSEEAQYLQQSIFQQQKLLNL